MADKERNPLPMVHKIIVGITSVLVVIPALINSAFDVYRALNNIPNSQAERDNKKYYEDYFGKIPVFKGEVPLVTDNGKVTISLEVHSKGDILVRYGSRSQWFPFPSSEPTSISMNLISYVYAEDSVKIGSDDSLYTLEQYIQYDSKNDGKIIRQQYYSDGQSQTITINPITGELSKSDFVPYVAPPKPASPGRPTSVDVYKFPEIDISTK